MKPEQILASAPFSLPTTEPPLLVIVQTKLRYRSYNDHYIYIQQYSFFYHNQVTAGTGCAALPQTLEKKLMGLKSVFIRIDFNWIQLICECRCSSEWLARLQVPAGHPQAISDPRHVLIYLTAWQQYYLWSGSGSYRCFRESSGRCCGCAAAFDLPQR